MFGMHAKRYEKRRMTTLIMFMSFIILWTLCGGIQAKTTENQNYDDVIRKIFECYSENKGILGKEFFSSNIQADQMNSEIAKDWKNVNSMLGAYHNVTSLAKFRIKDDLAITARVAFDNGGMCYVLVFDDKYLLKAFWNTGKDCLPESSIKRNIKEKEVVIGQAPYTLGATLSMPARMKNKCPGVVFVHGSGPQDRDESVGAQKPFSDLAAGLANMGIITLRYDKKTYSYNEKINTIDKKLVNPQFEAIDDTLSALNLLKRMPEVDQKRLYIFGHSLGGFLAPEIARQDNGIRGIILCAANYRPLHIVAMDQIEKILKNDTDISYIEKISYQKTLRDLVRMGQGKLTDNTMVLGAPVAYWKALRSIDNDKIISSLSCRILIIQGGNDENISMEDFYGWKKLTSRIKDVTVKYYSELNHFILSDKAAMDLCDLAIPKHVPEHVINDIALWIQSDNCQMPK